MRIILVMIIPATDLLGRWMGNGRTSVLVHVIVHCE